MKQERRALLLGVLLALLLFRSLRALLSSVFFESLDTLRMNASAAWTVVLLAPLLAPVAGRRGLRIALAVGGAGSALLPLARFTPAYIPVAAVASGALLLALALAMPRAGAMAGVLAGLALDRALLMLGGSHDPTLVAWTIPLALAATALAVVLALRAEEPPLARGWLEGIGMGALLGAELAFLADPYAAARWLHAPAWVAGVASLAGLAAGTTLAARARWPLWLAGALGLADVAFVRSPVAVVSLALVQAALGAAAVRLAPRAAPVTLALSAAPLLFVLLFFRDPLGLAEWGAIVPLLALAALFPAARLAHAPTPRAWLPTLAVVALALVAAFPAPTPEPPAGRELTVVTWNVHQGFGNRGALDPALYAEVLRELDADIILLQESDTARLSSGGLDIVRYLADELGMHAAYGAVGPSILSRYPIVGPTRETSPWSLETTIDVDGARVAVQSVHFGRDRAQRQAQADALAAAPPGPRILAGDFNLFTGFEGPPYTTLAARYQDAWVEAGHASVDPAGHTFRLPNLRIRIDIVFVDGFEVLEAERVLDERTRLASDHIPVVARLRPAA